ncbi:MAG: transcription antitermination factor NusB [Gammaproteobacteria bacterium]|nr:MAG: transcription antitermination factor NusB [Gammaproteobacteria bacterium]
MSTGQSDKPARKASPVELRRRARRYGLQALYQWHMAHTAPYEIEAQFLSNDELDRFDQVYFSELFRGVADDVQPLDALLEPCVDRPLKELDPIEYAICRMGAWELKHRLDIPYRVVINEAVELAKAFGGTDGHKFVNRVLDRLSGTLRKAEVDARRTPRK